MTGRPMMWLGLYETILYFSVLCDFCCAGDVRPDRLSDAHLDE